MRGLSYYWSASQGEYATDIVFDNAQSLQRLSLTNLKDLRAMQSGHIHRVTFNRHGKY